LPSEEDYDAIREAFMETSRGRWFLGEYAKRNRNADTRMVLDAVARIEETLAAQKQPEPAPDNSLAEALAAIRSGLDEARTAASSAIDGLALEQKLTPVRKGIRVIREISWRLREIGADGRICDLIDSQVSAIEGACGQISSADPKDAISAAFDLLEGRIGEFAEGEAAAPTPQPTAEAVSPSPAPSDEMPPAAVEELQTAGTGDDAEVANGAAAMPVETTVATNEAADVTAEAVDVTVEADAATTGAIEITAEAEAYDDALLDMVALEMAAPDPTEADEFSEIEIVDIDLAEPPANSHMAASRAFSSEVGAGSRQENASNKEIEPPFRFNRNGKGSSPEPVTVALPAPVEAPLRASLQPALKPSREPSPKPSLEPSLGSTILATGIVQRPGSSAIDPLAPIRRMSQAEKVAFFS
jgi:hypothetical protein